ncbi:hypothetical protein TNCV_154841 [Trichonephila clavipes]|uniref:Uncharacterized protein n=1 Tax=Trichonephila clavipes TaxID=2585209 RepID=A0A8X6WIT7_TRICX|nr:hypothetical protein TNCV_154841 [Trichonephila clavipes]
MESMIRLTTSASTIESPIISNTLTLKSIEFPPRSAIVRVSVVTSRLPPIVLALVCISCRFLLSLGNDCSSFGLYLGTPDSNP